MGKQLEIFPAPEPTADDRLNAAQAEMRRERMLRDATKPDADGLTREQRRSRRRRAVRAKTVSVKRMTKRELELGRALFPPDENADVERPKTRGDCIGAERPCPFVACKHHLYLDVSARSGAIKVNFPDIGPEELEESCALDVADRGGVTLERVGEVMNVTRERIRQVEIKALAKCHASAQMHALRDYAGEGERTTKRRLPLLEEGEGTYEDEPDTFSVATDFDVDGFAGDALDDTF